MQKKISMCMYLHLGLESLVSSKITMKIKKYCIYLDSTDHGKWEEKNKICLNINIHMSNPKFIFPAFSDICHLLKTRTVTGHTLIFQHFFLQCCFHGLLFSFFNSFPSSQTRWHQFRNRRTEPWILLESKVSQHRSWRRKKTKSHNWMSRDPVVMTCLLTKNAVPLFLMCSLKAYPPALVGLDSPSLGQIY